MSFKKIPLNGINVFPFTSEQELIRYIDTKKGILIAINAEKILHSSSQMKELINCNTGYCDGIGAVMGLKKKGITEAKKISGCELWLSIISHFHSKKTFYLVGGTQSTIEATVKKLKNEFPEIIILNHRNGYIRSETEQNLLIEDIQDKKPDIVFVAMGSPRQELLMEKMQKVHPDAIYQGLGGSFDVYTEKIKRAPYWWRKHNLEFAYRLLRQPLRIRRQIHLLKFWILLHTKNI